MKRKKREHKTEIRKREIWDNYCVQPGCKFKGELAAQGVCHTVPAPFYMKVFKDVLRHGEEMLKDMRDLRYKNKARTTKQWIKYLEGHIVCQWANGWFTLEELIHLRAENAKLRLAAGKWRKPPRAKKPRTRRCGRAGD